MEDPSTLSHAHHHHHHHHHDFPNAPKDFPPHPPLRLFCKASTAAALARAAIAVDDSPAPGCCDMRHVSVGGTEAVVRALQGIVEAECCEGSPFVYCRVMIPKYLVGPFIGMKGQNVKRIGKESGARVRVLPLAAFSDGPAASPAAADDVVQISGDPLAVKEAAIAVSTFLQVNPLSAGSSAVSYAEPQSKLYDGSHVQETKKNQHEISYRLLCLNRNVGGVIGKGATIVKALEKETGASIRFGGFVAQSDERVITITGFESHETGFSPSQNAVIRVFTRIVEAFMERRIGLEKKDPVIARLLVPSDQLNCLFVRGGTVVSEIGKVTGTDISIISGSQVPNCISGNDVVVQVSGKVQNVKDGLFQITSKLRENIFSSKMPSNSGSACQSCQRSDVSLSKGLEATAPGYNRSSTPSDLDHQKSLVRGLDNLRLHSNSHPFSSQLQRSETANGHSMPMSGYEGGHAPSRCMAELGRGSKIVTVRKTTTEIVVPGSCVPLVYGNNGANLASIRQISGAKVTVNDPLPGASERMVVISGTPDQSLAAQSLLQAYILSGKS